jgi:DNA-binding transcriptional LysR family regulator
MDFHKLDLNLLKVVAAIADTGSVSLAAKKLNVTQPAVSNSLSRLRQICGDEVFIRSRTGQEPTHFGGELVVTSYQVLADIAACFERLTQFDPNTMSRTFNVAIDEGIAAILLPRILKYWQELPNITLHVSHASGESSGRDLELGETDLLIGLNTYETSRIAAEVILRDQLVVTLSKNHPLAKKEKLTIEDFNQLEFAIVRPNKLDYQTPELMLRSMGVHRKVAFEAPQSYSLPAIVAETDLASTLPRQLFGPQIALYQLKTFPMPFEFPRLEVFVGYSQSERNQPAINWLKNEMKTALSTPI